MHSGPDIIGKKELMHMQRSKTVEARLGWIWKEEDAEREKENRRRANNED